MSVRAKKLVNPYELKMLEFLQTYVESGHKVHTQVSLSQVCEQVSNLDWELIQFLRSSSAVDAIVTDSDYMPCLAVEFQSQYHDCFEAKERDRKKATLLSLAGVPLIYSRIKNFGLLCLFSKNEEVIFNLFTGAGLEDAKVLIRKYCEQPRRLSA